MRRIVYFIGITLLMVNASNLKGQDLLVTINNDSLNVKIEKETDRFVYYNTPNKSKSSLVISKKQIASIVYGYYSSTETAGGAVNNEEIINSTEGSSSNKEEKLNRFQVSASIGYSRLLVINETEDQFLKDYFNKLYNGYDFSFQVNYFFSKRIGIGFLFEKSNFEYAIEGVHLSFANGLTAYGTLSDEITLIHVGPTFNLRLPFKRSYSAIQFDAGLGYSTYRNEAKIAYGYELRGETIGISVGATYQLSLGGGLYIPFKIGVKSAVFANLDLNTADNMPDELENDLERQLENDLLISGERIELSIGLLYSF